MAVLRDLPFQRTYMHPTTCKEQEAAVVAAACFLDLVLKAVALGRRVTTSRKDRCSPGCRFSPASQPAVPVED